MSRQRFTYGVHVIAESLNSFTAIVSILLLHLFPFPYVAAEVHVMGSYKVDLNRLPTTGYLGESLNSFTATASTLLLNLFMFSYVEFLQCSHEVKLYVAVEVHVRGSCKVDLVCPDRGSCEVELVCCGRGSCKVDLVCCGRGSRIGFM